MTSYGKLILRDDKTTEEFALSDNTIIGYGAHCDIRLLTAAQNKPFTQALIVSNGQKVHVTNLSDGSSGPTLVNGRMLKHNESIQLNSGDVLAFSFRQFLFEYVAPLSVPGQRPSARRETIAPSSQMMPIVVQRTISQITNRRASVPEDKLSPPSATLPDSTFEDNPVEGSPTLPEYIENEAAIIEMESTAAIESILGLSTKTSVNPESNNKFKFCETPAEKIFEPQQVLPTQKDTTPVNTPGTVVDTKGEICDVSTILNKLPAGEGQPETSDIINSSVGHDETFVPTSQTDNEMTSEPQNFSLVNEKELVLLFPHTRELKKPHDFLKDLPKTPKEDAPGILVIDQLQQISDEDELKGHPRSKFDSPSPLRISLEAGIQSAGRPSKAAKCKSAHQPAQTRGKGKELIKSQCIEQVQETKRNTTKNSPEPEIEEQILESKRKGRKPIPQSHISGQVQDTKRRGRKNISEHEFVEQMPVSKRRGRRKVPEPPIVEQMIETTLKGTKNQLQTAEQTKGNKREKLKISEEGKLTEEINEPKTANETKSTRKHSKPEGKPDGNEAEKRVTRSMSKKYKKE